MKWTKRAWTEATAGTAACSWLNRRWLRNADRALEPGRINMVGRWLMQQGCGLKGDRARDTGTTYWILSCGIPLRALYPFRPAPIQRRAAVLRAARSAKVPSLQHSLGDAAQNPLLHRRNDGFSRTFPCLGVCYSGNRRRSTLRKKNPSFSVGGP